MECISIRDAARELDVSAPTLRRWIAQGAPTVRPGEPGRGRGSLVDLDAVRRWRAERAGIAASDAPPLEAIARGLLTAYSRGNDGESDPVWRALGINSRKAAVILAEAYVSIVRELTGGPPIDYPPPVETLHKCAVSLSSVAMGTTEDRNQ